MTSWDGRLAAIPDDDWIVEEVGGVRGRTYTTWLGSGTRYTETEGSRQHRLDGYGDPVLGPALIRDDQLTDDERGARAAGRMFAQLGYDGALVTLNDLMGEEGLLAVAREVGRVLGICDCRLSMDPDSPAGLHSAAEHERGSCGGLYSYSGACGGCYDCLGAQHAYYERMERAARPG